MAAFPLSVNFYGDFVLKLLVVDTEHTMDEVAEAASENVIGLHVAAQDAVVRVRIPGESEPLPRDLTVAEAGLSPTQTLDFYYEEAS